MAYTVYDLAKLSNAVYDISKTEVDGWRHVRTFGNPKSGFFAALFERSELFVFAIRGTDDGYDLVPDAQIFASLVPVQLAQAQAALDTSLTVSKLAKLVLTGHSLGGGLAALLATSYGKSAVTFNAPGVARSYANMVSVLGGILPSELAAAYVTVTTMNSSTLLNIRANLDIVSVGTGTQIGNVDSISVAGCTPAWDEFGVRLERLPLDMMMNRATGPYDPFGDMSKEIVAYVICQHGMELMERQISKMPEYSHDLGW